MIQDDQVAGPVTVARYSASVVLGLILSTIMQNDSVSLVSGRVRLQVALHNQGALWWEVGCRQLQTKHCSSNVILVMHLCG